MKATDVPLELIELGLNSRRPDRVSLITRSVRRSQPQAAAASILRIMTARARQKGAYDLPTANKLLEMLGANSGEISAGYEYDAKRGMVGAVTIYGELRAASQVRSFAKILNIPPLGTNSAAPGPGDVAVEFFTNGSFRVRTCRQFPLILSCFKGSRAEAMLREINALFPLRDLGITSEIAARGAPPSAAKWAVSFLCRTKISDLRHVPFLDRTYRDFISKAEAALGDRPVRHIAFEGGILWIYAAADS